MHRPQRQCICFGGDVMSCCVVCPRSPVSKRCSRLASKRLGNRVYSKCCVDYSTDSAHTSSAEVLRHTAASAAAVAASHWQGQHERVVWTRHASRHSTEGLVQLPLVPWLWCLVPIRYKRQRVCIRVSSTHMATGRVTRVVR